METAICPEGGAIMRATVTRACPCHLLVCDHATSQEVFVHTPDACRFRRGDRVCIGYNGAMTLSLPPQITAYWVRRDNCRC